MRRRKERSFGRMVFFSCVPSNVVTGFFIYLYTVAVIQLDTSLWGIAFVVVLSIVSMCQIVLAPLSNMLISRRLSRRLQRWREEELSDRERTELLQEVQSFPRKKQLEACIYFASGTGILAMGYAYFLNVDLMDIIACVAICLFSTHIAGVLNLFASSRLCSELARQLVGQGVHQDMVRKRSFGMNFSQSYVQLIVVPLVFTTILFMLTYAISLIENGYRILRPQLLIISMVVAVNMMVVSVLAITFFTSVIRSSRMLQESMEHITQNDIFTVEPIPTDMADEISYNMYLVNNVIHLFQAILTRIRTIGQSLLMPIDELQHIADETATVSFQQSSGVQEMLATVEENESQVEEIARRLEEVVAVIGIASGNLEKNYSILRDTAGKMEEIYSANATTCQGIWTLGEKVNGVWNIVSGINAIADQTRIIGFNAELKASEAGEIGGNFMIIANEIKRLAGSIMDAVVLIQARIAEVQATSDNLIISSEGGTQLVQEAGELSRKLVQRLDDIKVSTDITRDSVEDIALIIQQQSMEFQQVVKTAGTISSGIEMVSASMAMVRDIADQLKVTGHRLENLNTEIIQDDQ